MKDLYLFAEAKGTRMAIPASRVESVVREMELVRVPLADPSVAGIAALRSRVVTIVDLVAAITSTPAGDCSGKPVIVAAADTHFYGFAVDAVHDIVEAREDPKPVETELNGGWRRAATGFVDTREGALIVIDPLRLVAGIAEAA